MKLLPLEYLAGLPRPFDAFAGGAGIDGKLIARGFSPPLPVNGSSLVWGGYIIDAAVASSLPGLYAEELSIGPGEALLLALRLENRADAFGYDEMEAIYEAAAGIIGRESADPDIRNHPLVRDVNPLVLRDAVFADRILRYRNLKTENKRLVREGIIDLKTAEFADCLETETLRLLASPTVRGAWQPTSSERRAVFRLFTEIARRDGLDSEAQLHLADAVFEAEAPPAGKKIPKGKTEAERALARLARLRYPGLTELEERFEALREAALSGSGVRLDPPPLFEGDRYSVSFSFSDRRSLDSRIRSLSGLRERCDDLADLLH